MKKKKVIIAPLDWGLGHATRCIPIIRACIERGCEVTIICSGRSLALLQNEFPQLQFIDLPAYNIYYQKKGSFVFKIIMQLQKVFSGIKREHKELNTIIEKIKPDLIISDNRYGLWSKKVKSILITHQMLVKIPSLKFAEPIVHWWLMQQHNKFNEVWIPDVAGIPNISGDLSHKYKLPDYIKHIGILTRFKKPDILPQKEYDVLVILSGPEPQRTIFEEKIIAQSKTINKKFVIVSGKAENKTDIQLTDNMRIISYSIANELFELILRSEIILSRGGYSTLMDLAHLNKKCIFIPTPGQTEQEYLVKELREQNLIYATDQNSFDLQTAVNEVGKTKGFFIDTNSDEFLKTLEQTLSSI
ncbi:MAG: glycosyltransferase [Fimbriimonadaceae bacterium]|nr:glycosyltransferase [Chitinophagales bacterium]